MRGRERSRTYPTMKACDDEGMGGETRDPKGRD